MRDEWIFDFDNHYYEAEDAFTRHQDRSLGSRGVRWAEIGGRRRLLVGGRLDDYIANPTFDPVARPGSLYDWYRGNPERKTIREAFGDLEPIRPEYRDPDARIEVMDRQRVAGTLLFPTLGVGMEEALKDDPEACAKVFHGFNRWLAEDWVSGTKTASTVCPTSRCWIPRPPSPNSSHGDRRRSRRGERQERAGSRAGRLPFTVRPRL